MSDSFQPHGLQHARLRCPSPSPGACSNSCPSSWRCHRTISSSVVPFSSCLQSFPTSGSFPMSRFFASGGQSIGASASVLPMTIHRTFSGFVVSIVGSVHFWLVPWSDLYFSRSIGAFLCSPSNHRVLIYCL